MPDEAWKRIDAELARVLVPAGFVRRGKPFVDQRARPVVKEIAVERSRWNVPGRRRFALLLTISVGDREARDYFAPDRDARYTPVFRKRTGYLRGEEALEFTVPEDGLEPLFAALDRHLEEDVLPFCRRIDSVEALIAVLEAENARLGEPFFSATLAVALARLGRLDEARKYFAEMQGVPENVRTFAARYGVQL